MTTMTMMMARRPCERGAYNISIDEKLVVVIVVIVVIVVTIVIIIVVVVVVVIIIIIRIPFGVSPDHLESTLADILSLRFHRVGR